MGPSYGGREWLERAYERVESDPWGLDWRPSQQRRYRAMRAVLRSVAESLGPTSLVLDFGCATGGFTAMLRDLVGSRGATVVGVDVSAKAIERARLLLPDLAFERVSLEECAERYAGQVDLVTCLEVLYYIPAPERPAALQRMASLLKPGGHALFSSMVGGAPYFSPDALAALVGTRLRVVSRGLLHLRPISIVERAVLRVEELRPRRLRRRGPGAMARLIGRALGPGRGGGDAPAPSWLPASWTVSHAYVLAQAPPEGAAVGSP